MVPTNSLSGTLNFRGEDLFHSEFEQDQELLRTAGQVLDELVTKLTPILRYVDSIVATEVRGVIVADDANGKLLLGRDGTWYYCGMDGLPGKNQRAWHYFEFEKITSGLEEVFAQATQKRAEHMAAVQQRTDLLQRVGAVIRGEAVPAQQ